MSLPSIGHSVTGGTSPIPSHQAIGSNGSFWLPEKIDPSFGSKVKNSTPSKEGSRQGAGKPVVSGKPASGEKSPPRASFSGGRATVVAKGATGGKLTNAQPLPLSKSGLSSTKALPSESSSSGSVHSARPSGQEQVLHAQQTKLTRNSNRTNSHPDAPFQRVRVARSGRGREKATNTARIVAKNALSDSKMDIAYSQQISPRPSDGEISRDPAASLAPKARSFMKFLSNVVSPGGLSRQEYTQSGPFCR